MQHVHTSLILQIVCILKRFVFFSPNAFRFSVIYLYELIVLSNQFGNEMFSALHRILVKFRAFKKKKKKKEEERFASLHVSRSCESIDFVNISIVYVVLLKILH